MKHLDAVNTSCRKSVWNAGLKPEGYFAAKCWRANNTANNQWTGNKVMSREPETMV
jgi:hypothetical protein